MGNFTKTEKTIFTLALLVLVLFTYFLYDDSLIFPRESTSNLQPIGDISASSNDVRRKNIENFSWMPAGKTDQVFENDSIFTGDNSEAQITLQDGSILKIEPNSLITLNLNNGEMSLDLRYGNLIGELNEGSSLKVTSGQEEFKLEGKKDSASNERPKIKVKRATKGVVDLKLLSGAAQIANKAEPPKPLVKEQSVAVTATKIAPVVRHEITLLTNNNISFLRHTPTSPLKFNWDSTGKVLEYQLDISSDPSFENSTKTYRTKNKSFDIIEELDLGRHYWRVSTLDEGGINSSSETRNFNLVTLPVPEIVLPANDAVQNLELKKIAGKLTYSLPFEWKASEVLKKFKWQLANIEDFSQIISEGNTTTTDAKSPALESGKYYLRVQGFSEKNAASNWSATHSFTLNLTEKTILAPSKPVLTTPEIKTKVTSETTPAPIMGWRKVPEALSYIVEVSPDKDFTSKIEFKTKSTRITWTDYKPGNYHFRVSAIGENNLTSAYSDLGKILIETANLELNPIETVRSVGANAKPQSIPVSWTAIPFTKKYKVQVSKDGQFRDDGILVVENRGNIVLSEPGSYKVRVSALDEANKPTSVSNIQEAIYSHRPPLAAPKLIEPFNNASIFLQKNTEPFIWLEWSKSQNATSYKVEVSDSKEFKKLILSSEQKENRFLIKTKLPLRKIFWRVRARSLDNNEYSDWTEPRHFMLHHQKNEGVVQ